LDKAAFCRRRELRQFLERNWWAMQDLNLKRNNSQRPRRGKDADPGIADVELQDEAGWVEEQIVHQLSVQIIGFGIRRHISHLCKLILLYPGT